MTTLFNLTRLDVSLWSMPAAKFDFQSIFCLHGGVLLHVILPVVILTDRWHYRVSFHLVICILSWLVYFLMLCVCACVLRCKPMAISLYLGPYSTPFQQWQPWKMASCGLRGCHAPCWWVEGRRVCAVGPGEGEDPASPASTIRVSDSSSREWDGVSVAKKL